MYGEGCKEKVSTKSLYCEVSVAGLNMQRLCCGAERKSRLCGP